MELVTAAFGQFVEGHLTTIMSFTFNSRRAPVRTWNEAEDCRADRRPRGSLREVDTKRFVSACGWTVETPGGWRVTDAAWQKAEGVVAQLGSQRPAPLRFTRAFATDNAGNFLQMRRMDFTEPSVLGSPASTGSAPQEARTAWLRAYLPMMLDGIEKNIDATELEPNQTQPPRLRLTLPD